MGLPVPSKRVFLCLMKVISNLTLEEQLKVVHTYGLNLHSTKLVEEYLLKFHPKGTTINGKLLEPYLRSRDLVVIKHSGKAREDNGGYFAWDYEIHLADSPWWYFPRGKFGND